MDFGCGGSRGYCPIPVVFVSVVDLLQAHLATHLSDTTKIRISVYSSVLVEGFGGFQSLSLAPTLPGSHPGIADKAAPDSHGRAIGLDRLHLNQIKLFILLDLLDRITPLDIGQQRIQPFRMSQLRCNKSAIECISDSYKNIEFCICIPRNLCYAVFIPVDEMVETVSILPEVVCVTGLPARTAKSSCRLFLPVRHPHHESPNRQWERQIC